MYINNKYEVKRLSHSRVKDYIAVYRKSFNSIFTLNQFYRIFGKKDEYWGYIAYDKNTPVAFFGIIVFNFSYKEETILAAQSISTMVTPEYRNDDLIICRYLSKATYELAKTENIKLIYGWPNNAIFTKRVLCLIDLGKMKKISYNVNTLPIAKIAWKLSFLRNIYRSFFLLFVKSYLTKTHDNLKIKNKIDNTFYIKRETEYLKYKAALGSFVLNINKKNIWMNIDFRIKIGDLEDMNYSELEIIFKKIKSIAFWTGITEIVFTVDKTSQWINVFKKNNAHINDSFNLMYIPLHDKYNLDHASLTMGDFDTF